MKVMISYVFQLTYSLKRLKGEFDPWCGVNFLIPIKLSGEVFLPLPSRLTLSVV